jgi:D-ribose pyranase
MLADHAILNPRLVQALAAAGHTEVVVIADAGLPIPARVPVIDLSVVAGMPSLEQVAGVVLRSLAVESAVVAHEAAGGPAGPMLGALLGDLPRREVSHEEFKALVDEARVVVRTGECTPYANVALRCGTTF